MSNCEICSAKHVPGCVATHTDGSGRAVCVFCLDSMPCPVLKRVLQKQRRSISGEEDKKVSVSTKVNEETVGKANTAEAITTMPVARICRVPDCGISLATRNRSGFCSRHFHRSETKKTSKLATLRRCAPPKGGVTTRPSIRTNGHAIASIGNSKNGSNGDSVPNPLRAFQGLSLDGHVSEERLNLVILAWPLEQKVKALSAWLTAAI